MNKKILLFLNKTIELFGCRCWATGADCGFVGRRTAAHLDGARANRFDALEQHQNLHLSILKKLDDRRAVPPAALLSKEIVERNRRRRGPGLAVLALDVALDRARVREWASG